MQKNSRVIDPAKKPNDFYGNHYYTTNYGVISSIIIDAYSNMNNKKDTNLRMNNILEDLINGKYNLIKSDSDYKNSADIKELFLYSNIPDLSYFYRIYQYLLLKLYPYPTTTSQGMTQGISYFCAFPQWEVPHKQALSIHRLLQTPLFLSRIFYISDSAFANIPGKYP